MLEVVNYRVDGMKLRVRLKCACGACRVIKTMKNNEEYYQCVSCKAEASLRKLKSEASAYWQGRRWEIECEESKKPSRGVFVDYAARVSAQAHRSGEPYCVLTGHCVEISESGLLFIARDFLPSYFQGMRCDNRYAVVDFIRPVKGLPPTLRGSIVEIKFLEEKLPLCHIRIVFERLPDVEQGMIRAHLIELRGRVTEWTAA
jgi:hypothetical protein